jgi:hypothetical protein
MVAARAHDLLALRCPLPPPPTQWHSVGRPRPRAWRVAQLFPRPGVPRFVVGGGFGSKVLPRSAHGSRGVLVTLRWPWVPPAPVAGGADDPGSRRTSEGGGRPLRLLPPRPPSGGPTNAPPPTPRSPGQAAPRLPVQARPPTSRRTALGRLPSPALRLLQHCYDAITHACFSWPCSAPEAQPVGTPWLGRFPLRR